MFILGLTGSIGMGKSTTARLFARGGRAGARCRCGGAPALRRRGGRRDRGGVSRHDGERQGRSRQARARVVGTPAALKRLEAIVHPLVRAGRDTVPRKPSARGASIVVLDIPLLFETGGEKRVDAVVVVTAPAEIQRERVLERPA